MKNNGTCVNAEVVSAEYVWVEGNHGVLRFVCRTKDMERSFCIAPQHDRVVATVLQEVFSIYGNGAEPDFRIGDLKGKPVVLTLTDNLSEVMAVRNFLDYNRAWRI